jgi:hypothetical protein
VRLRRLAVVLAAGALALPLPGVALAQGGAGSLTPGGGTGNALTPGLPQPQATIPTTPAPTATAPVSPQPSTTSSSPGGLTGSDAIAIAVGAVLVLGGIAYFIWWDARKRAPKRGHLATAGAGAPGRRAGSKPPPKPRKPSAAERRRRKRGRAR